MLRLVTQCRIFTRRTSPSSGSSSPRYLCADWLTLKTLRPLSSTHLAAFRNSSSFTFRIKQSGKNHVVCVTSLNYRSDLALFPSFVLSFPHGVHFTVTDVLAVAVRGVTTGTHGLSKTCKRWLPNRLFLTFEQCWTPHRAVAGDAESRDSHVRNRSDETCTTYRPAGFEPHTTYGYGEMWWDAASDEGSRTASPRPPARVPGEELNVLQVFQGRRHTSCK